MSPFTTIPDSPQLITSPALQSLNIAINTKLKLIICLICETAFTIDGIYAHLINIHKQQKVQWAPSFKEDLKQAFLLYQIPDNIYPILLPDQLYCPFDGLSVQGTFGCNLCFHNGGKKSLQNHLREHHPGAQMPGNFVPCSAQYINKYATKLLLRVQQRQQLQQLPQPQSQPQQSQHSQFTEANSQSQSQSQSQPEEPPQFTEASSQLQSQSQPQPQLTGASSQSQLQPQQSQFSEASSTSALQDFHSFHQQSRDLTKATAPNARFISPFLQRTGWYDHVQSYPIPILRKLVSFPGATEFPSVIVAVRTYFDDGNDLLDIRKTPELVLQRLNSDNPQKNGINNTPMHKHQQLDTTAKQYVDLICRLLAALLRVAEEYVFPTSPQLVTALSSLRENPNNETVHEVCMALWYVSWHSVSDTTSFPDPTMCFMALIHLQLEGHFAHPKTITPHIAQLTWAIRIVMIQQIHILVRSGQAIDFMAAMDIVNPYVLDHSPTTFGSLRSLTHFASYISECTLAPPRIWWTDPNTYLAMQYEGHPLTFDHLKTVFENLETQVVTMWKDQILMGLDLYAQYGLLVDNLTERRPGYCFIEEPDNSLAQYRLSLMQAIISSPSHQKQFYLPNQSVLNMMECRRWLQALSEFEKYLMLGIDMTGGAPPRGTELTSMMIRNSPLRLRNVMSLGKYISIVRQYDKTTNNRQADRLIPHAISAVYGDLIIQLHALARPLAQFFSSKLFDPSVTSMYYDLAFMDFGKEFTSAKITDSMARISFPVLNWRLTISSWRHINIAFKRKLCSKSYALLTDEESNVSSSAHALQSGHSARTENRIYGLSPESLIGATEDIMQVFLNASTEWQTLFGITPGGSMLKFHQATMDKYGSLQAMGHLPSSIFSKHSIPSQPLPPRPNLAQQTRDDTVINILESLSNQINVLKNKMDEIQKQQQQHSSPIAQNPLSPETVFMPLPETLSQTESMPTSPSQSKISNNIARPPSPEFQEQQQYSSDPMSPSPFVPMTSIQSSSITATRSTFPSFQSHSTTSRTSVMLSLSTTHALPTKSTRARTSVLSPPQSTSAPPSPPPASIHSSSQIQRQSKRARTSVLPQITRAPPLPLPPSIKSSFVDLSQYRSSQIQRPSKRARTSVLSPPQTTHAPPLPASIQSSFIDMSRYKSSQIQRPSKRARISVIPQTTRAPPPPASIQSSFIAVSKLKSPSFHTQYKDSPAQLLRSLPHGNDVTFNGDMLCLLQGFYGSTSNWRCAGQRDALKAVMKMEQDVIVALGAGVGKTAVALLPSIYEDGYTVIILGLKSLMEDWEHRLNKLDLPYETYTGARLTGNYNIILASCDRVQSAYWKESLGLLTQRRPVLRLIFDEVHQYFTEVQFRPKAFGNPFALRSVPCQLVLMSGSLPPPSLPHINNIFGLHNPITFRTPALSCHIIYRLHRPLSQLAEMTSAILEYITTWESGMLFDTADRYLIFVAYWEDGKELAKFLGCPFYHGSKKQDQLSDGERNAILKQWRNGETKHRSLVATSALSAGLDYPSVRLGFFVKLPADMITFYQQSHRIARDRRTGSCIVFPKPNNGNTGKLKNSDPVLDKLRGVEEMLRFGNQRCLRYQLSSFLDKEGEKCGSGHEPCGTCHDYGKELLFSQDNLHDEPFCNGGPLAIPSSSGQQRLKRKLDDNFLESCRQASTRFTTVVRSQQTRFDDVEKLLNLYGKGCGACILENKGNLPGHPFQDCPSLSLQQIQDCDALRKTLNYKFWTEGNGACWKCHIPGGGQNQWHGNYGESECPQAHLIWSMAYVVWSKVDWREKMRKDLEIQEDLTAEVDFTRWFTKKHQKYFTSGIALLTWVATHVLRL